MNVKRYLKVKENPRHFKGCAFNRSAIYPLVSVYNDNNQIQYKDFKSIIVFFDFMANNTPNLSNL